MTRDERLKLEALRKANVPVKQIAKQLGCCRQTIYNELERGKCEVIREVNGYYRDVEEYSADKGQIIHEENQKMKGRPMKIGSDYAYADYLERLMLGIQPNGKVDRRKRYSPAAALAMARREGYQTSVCVNTLYSYIDKGIFLNLTNKDLWEKGKKKQGKKQKVRRTLHPLLPSITERPEHIDLRAEAGHHEMDLIVGKEGTKAATLTLTDRKKRTELAYKISDKRAATVRAVFDRLERRLGKRRFREMFKTITTDNGPEFLEYEELTKSIYGGKRFEVYYCHSYSAWEKGTNENHNRFMRRSFPKGTDFTKISQREITEAQEFMDHYPRKILDWKMPVEVV